MTRFRIIHAFNLKSHRDKLLFPGSIFTTEDEAQIAELQSFAKDGACEEMTTKVEVAEGPVAPPVDPTDDITLAKGVGAKTIEKLAKVGITTLSGLKAAMTEREEEMKELLGSSFEKVLANFVEAKPDDVPPAE